VRFLLFAPVLLSLFFNGTLASAETLRIAVASNFKPTLELINKSFETDTGIRILLSSASTGTLANQVRYGAPFDLFLSADASTAQDLAREFGRESFCYAVGRLTLVGGPIEQLGSADKTLAIANPVTAPYGRAAMQVLSRDEFSRGNSRTLIRGNNAAQAYQFWHSKSADLALVPRALAPEGSIPIPSAWHSPIEQHAVVVKESAHLARYLKWLRSDRVRTLINQAGYESCP
jgi:molybdate transport system substrate-binding protein